MVTTQQITWREYFGEFISAYALALITLMALFKAPSSLVHLIVAVFFGVLFTIMKKRIIAFGNPVISLAMLGLRKISLKLGLALISFQLAAGALAGLTVRGIIPNIGTRLEGLATYTKFSWVSASGEFFAALLLVAAVMAVMAAVGSDKSAEGSSTFNMSFVVYGSMFLGALIGSLGIANPAAVIGIGLHFNSAYTAAPFLGGLVGALIYSIVVEGRGVQFNFRKQQ